MKKLAIAGASAALAMLPAVGVFAASGAVGSHTDDLSVTVQPGCSFAGADSTNDTAAFGTMAGGTYDSQSTDGFTVFCNAAWDVSAYAGTKHTISSTDYAALATSGESPNYIDSTSTTINGLVSNWTMSLAATPTGATGFTADSIVPASSTVVLSGASGTGTSGVSIVPTYKISLNAGQPSGQYTGTVVYTIALHS